MKLSTANIPWILLLEIALASAILIYLFFRRRKPLGPGDRTPQRVEIKLLGRLSPSEVRVQFGRPAQLLIHRYDQQPAEELFEVEELEIYELLPALHTTIIAFQPSQRGEFAIILGGEKRVGIMIVE